MATHDYIISNASGASVRADLNNALAAIVSNNSNATSPATTYAYQWWADTTTGQLKLRNSANSAWITIFELDGTMLMEDGTVSAPGLAFASDLNTGFFRSAADKINFATGGAERLEIGSSEVVFNDPSNDVDFRVESNGNSHMLFVDAGNDRVGIGTGSPAQPVHLADALPVIRLEDTSTNAYSEIQSDNAGNLYLSADVANGQASSSIRLSVDNSEAVRIDSSGNVGIGTTSNLLVNSTRRTLSLNHTGSSAVAFGVNGTREGHIYVDNGEMEISAEDNFMSFRAGSSERMRIDTSGRLLLGSTSAIVSGALDNSLHLKSPSGPEIYFLRDDSGSTVAGNAMGMLRFYGNDNDGTAQECARIECEADLDHGNNDKPSRLLFLTTADGASSPTERLRIDSSGRVLISATSSYASSNADDLQIGDNTNSAQTGITLGSTVLSSLRFADAGSDSAGVISYLHSDNSMRFSTADSEAMRVDSSQRLLIGGTSATHSDAQSRLQVHSAGATNIVIARNDSTISGGNTIGMLQFYGNDGGTYQQCAEIRCDADFDHANNDKPSRLVFGTTATGASSATERMRITSTGEVQMTLKGGDVTKIGGTSNHSFFRQDRCGIHLTTNALLPTDGDGEVNDNSMDIGAAALRFDDIFATNGTIQTSDQTLKQDVAALTTAEIAVAKRIRDLVKTYRWIDAVEAKGDDARIHCGVIAQEVEQAFTAEGLDVNRYALFCKDTWYEVDGVPLTPDGPVTADDEGAVEVTRRGVRYPELLAFVMAGVNAEMADVKSRLAALEAA